jgi:riboflavin transporter FmnP
MSIRPFVYDLVLAIKLCNTCTYLTNYRKRVPIYSTMEHMYIYRTENVRVTTELHMCKYRTTEYVYLSTEQQNTSTELQNFCTYLLNFILCVPIYRTTDHSSLFAVA